ncbi:MAG: hypothetical protein ACK56I_29775, partial [bacterium]
HVVLAVRLVIGQRAGAHAGVVRTGNYGKRARDRTDTELAVAVDHHRLAAGDGVAGNAGHEGGSLSALGADADGVGIGGAASISDGDVVTDTSIVCAPLRTRLIANGNVVAAGQRADIGIRLLRVSPETRPRPDRSVIAADLPGAG